MVGGGGRRWGGGRGLLCRLSGAFDLLVARPFDGQRPHHSVSAPIRSIGWSARVGVCPVRAASVPVSV